MFHFVKLLVEIPINCPLCGHNLIIGDIMLKDDYRNETLCEYCKEDYKDSVISEEGEDGRLLK